MCRSSSGHCSPNWVVYGESLMTVYNDVMTVTELVNIVAFLESRYEKLERPGYRYPTYSLSE